MKGHKFLMVTSILMIISAVLGVLLGVIVGLFGAAAAVLGSALKFGYYFSLFLMLVGGVCEFIAGIKGVKYSQSSEKSQNLVKWGIVALAISVLGIVFSLINGGEVHFWSVVTSLIVPGLYIYGAVLNK